METERGVDRARLGRLGTVAVAMVAVAGLVACQSGGNAPSTKNVASESGTGGDKAAPKPKPKPLARISFEPGESQKTVKLDDIVKVRAAHGKLTSVVVRQKNGKALKGAMNAAKTEWTLAKSQFVPETAYEIKAEAVNVEGVKISTERDFTTSQPSADKVLGTDITPLDGNTVGVGMPLVVKFTKPIKDRAAIQKQLSVETSRSVEGAWHWFTDREVHYRPKTYWPAGTDVTLKINLRRISSGDGVWGIKDKVKRFHVGRSVVTKVDLRSHNAKVYVDGRLARVIPVTGGKKGWETRNGTKVVLGKETNKKFTNQMISAPEEYNLKAPFAMRVTWSGEYLHSAPWSVANHGRRNGSHGCVGMSTSNSAWLYHQVKLGDPVEVVGGGGQMPVTGNGYGDWNMSWSAWKRGSAL